MERKCLTRCAFTRVAYTCGGQKSKGRAYMLVAYTCGGQKSKACTYSLIAYTCGGQKSKERAYMLIANTLRWAIVFGVGPCTVWLHLHGDRIHLRWAKV